MDVDKFACNECVLHKDLTEVVAEQWSMVVESEELHMNYIFIIKMKSFVYVLRKGS